MGEDRRKRRAVDPPAQTLPQPTWPTKTGWTEVTATTFCDTKITEDALNEKCVQAAGIVNKTYDLSQSILNCVDDIRMTGGTTFLIETNEDLKERCLEIIEKDSVFQIDSEAKVVADEIRNLLCIPSDCSGQGRCDKGICLCHSGFLGPDCAITKEQLPIPEAFSLENNGACQFSANQDCQHIFVTGRHFVESQLLTCHFEVVEIDETGIRAVSGSSPTLSPAVLVTETTVECTFSTVKKSKHAVLVSVSNDGSAQSIRHLFLAHDPICQECDTVSRKCQFKFGTCDIDSQCYLANDVARNSSCLSCKPEKNPQLWSRLDGAMCQLNVMLVGGSGELSLPATVGIGVGAAFVLFLTLALIIKLVCVRKSHTSRKLIDHEHSDRNSSQSRYVNPAYYVYGDRPVILSSIDIEPQESFRGRNVHTRTNVTGHEPMPADNHR